jgi:hypothetical protein
LALCVVAARPIEERRIKASAPTHPLSLRLSLPPKPLPATSCGKSSRPLEGAERPILLFRGGGREGLWLSSPFKKLMMMERGRVARSGRKKKKPTGLGLWALYAVRFLFWIPVLMGLGR